MCNKLMTFYNKTLRRQLATRVFQFVQVDMIVVTTKLAIPLECKNFINVRIKNVK